MEIDANDHSIVLTRLSPRTAPIVFRAFPAGSVDIDHSFAWLAVRQNDRHPMAALLLEPKETAKGYTTAVVRFALLSDEALGSVPSFLQQTIYLCQRRGLERMACFGAVPERAPYYQALVDAGFESKDRLDGYRVEGRDAIEQLYAFEDRIVTALFRRDPIPEATRVVPYDEVSGESVGILVADSLGSVRRDFDHSPTSGIHPELSKVLLSGHRVVGAALVREKEVGRGFHVNALVVDPEFRLSWATPWLSREMLRSILDTGAEYYEFETNPAHSPTMVNHALRQGFEPIGASHFMTRAL